MKARFQRTVSVVIPAALLTAGLAFGQIGVDKRQRLHEKRIARAFFSDKLKTKKASKLERAEAKIQRKGRRAKGDHYFTAKERARERKALNKTRHKIYKQKHHDEIR